MSKYMKWFIIVLVCSQFLGYFWVRYMLPTKVVALIEKNGCDGYEAMGADLPIAYLYTTETEIIVYLTKDINNAGARLLKLKVNYIDTAPPFLKGIYSKARYQISSSEIAKNFSDCWSKA